MNTETVTEKIRLRNLPLEERVKLYNKAMSLRKKYGWGIFELAENSPFQ